MNLQYITTYEKLVGILTNHLAKRKCVFFRDKVGVVENTFLTGREH